MSISLALGVKTEYGKPIGHSKKILDNPANERQNEIAVKITATCSIAIFLRVGSIEINIFGRSD